MAGIRQHRKSSTPLQLFSAHLVVFIPQNPSSEQDTEPLPTGAQETSVSGAEQNLS